jgi:hypothetical protein
MHRFRCHSLCGCLALVVFDLVDNYGQDHIFDNEHERVVVAAKESNFLFLLIRAALCVAQPNGKRTCVLSEWIKLWTLRNDDRHGRDQATRLQAENRQVICKLHQFYENHDGRVPKRLRRLFEEPITTRLEWRTASIVM